MQPTDVDNFLAHFGKKGMRWGVRNADKGGDSSGGASESKAAAKKLAKVDLVNPDQLKKRIAKSEGYTKEAKRLKAENKVLTSELTNAGIIKRRQNTTQIAENAKRIKTAEKDAIAVRDGKMSSRQKKLLIGGAIVAGLIVAHGVNSHVQSGEFNRMAIKGKMLLNKDRERFKRKDSLANPNYSSDDIMKHVVPGVNPDYGSWGTNMNCRRATFAYEMRRRGLDVQATKTSNASGQNIVGLMNALSPGKKERGTGATGILKALKEDPKGVNSFSAFPAGGKKALHIPTAKSVFDALNKEPDGSRGEFGVMWASAVPGIPGGGHSMAYEIIKGKAHIFDTQNGKEYKADNKIFDMIDSAGYTRLDNVDLNENFLSKWVR